MDISGEGNFKRRSATPSQHAWYWGTWPESRAGIGWSFCPNRQHAFPKDGILLWAGFWHMKYRISAQEIWKLLEIIRKGFAFCETLDTEQKAWPLVYSDFWLIDWLKRHVNPYGVILFQEIKKLNLLYINIYTFELLFQRFFAHSYTVSRIPI